MTSQTSRESVLFQPSGNPLDNVYWFARMLVNTDKYGNVAKEVTLLSQLAVDLHVLLERTRKIDEHIQVEEAKKYISKKLLERWKRSKKIPRIQKLCDDLSFLIRSKRDIEVFALTCEKVLVPISKRLQRVPSNDREFVESMARAHLKTKGEKGLAEIIGLWDDLVVFACLGAERIQVVEGFTEIKHKLAGLFSSSDLDIIVSAFCQEFERRVAQKRKGRAGRGLESVSSFIFEFYSIPAVHAPEHFTTGLEIDKWVKCKDGWMIGISCKRTFRERWKQSYTTDIGLLNRHKIKMIWHLVAYDADLSDDKITEMGSHRCTFYLRDDSPIYFRASRHPGMKQYVRPMSKFVQDLRDEIGGTSEYLSYPNIKTGYNNFKNSI